MFSLHTLLITDVSDMLFIHADVTLEDLALQ